jgi:DNA-binding IclR family transcriptional regulator
VTTGRSTQDEAAPNLAADRVLQVLSAFLEDADELGVADVSRRVGLDKSVVHRILTTLVRHNYLEQNEETRKYRVGLTAWELGRHFTVRSWVTDLAVPKLHDLLQVLGSTGYVGALDGTDIVYLATVDGSGPFQVTATVGSRAPAFTSALGRAVLAAHDDAEVERLAADQLRDLSDAARDRLLAELQLTRSRGYGLSRGEARTAVGAVGAAVKDARGNPIGGISVAFPMLAEYDSLWDELPPAVVKVATEISRRMS